MKKGNSYYYYKLKMILVTLFCYVFFASSLTGYLSRFSLIKVDIFAIIY
jgi:hypothetical protein